LKGGIQNRLLYEETLMKVAALFREDAVKVVENFKEGHETIDIDI